MDALYVGIIRIFTTENQRILSAHGDKIEKLYSMESMNQCIPGPPRGINDNKREHETITQVIELALEMQEKKKVEGIAISCTAHMAKTISSKIVGILTFANEVPAPMIDIMGDSLISWWKLKATHCHLY